MQLLSHPEHHMPMKTDRHLQDTAAVMHLDQGTHPTPARGHCLMEVVSMLSGENFTADPACVCPILGAFGRTWNDTLPTPERQELRRYIVPLMDTNKGMEHCEQRAWLALDWLWRVHLPWWLDMLPDLAGVARELRAHAPLVAPKAGQDSPLRAVQALGTIVCDCWEAWRTDPRCRLDLRQESARHFMWGTPAAAAFSAANCWLVRPGWAQHYEFDAWRPMEAAQSAMFIVLAMNVKFTATGLLDKHRHFIQPKVHELLVQLLQVGAEQRQPSEHSPLPGLAQLLAWPSPIARVA
jgi:hypothetical protein